MIDDSQREKLDEMSVRIRQAEGKPAGDESAKEAKPIKMSNIGFDFLGAVLVCTFLGWLADKTLGIKPWGILSMMVIGFAVGIVNVWRALGNQKSE
jgi:ATP synthase protein I